MRTKKLAVAAFLLSFFSGVLVPHLLQAAITNPAPDQVFETGTTAVEVGWDPVEGAESYERLLLLNGTVFDAQAGIEGTTQTLENGYAPGYYTVFVRGVNATGKGPWSDPVTFKLTRTMAPGNNTVFLNAPTVFKWTRSPTAIRYLLKLAKYDTAAGKYVVQQKVWIPQPTAGMPKWNPPANSLGNGKFRWSLADYAGATAGLISTTFFRVKKVPSSNYLVIDLSGGTNATSYPVTYLNDVPLGGWSDTYKTTKLVMRRISAGTFTMGSPSGELGRYDNETQHRVTLTKSFYIGVFEVTQRQWELVMGNRPSYFTNSTYYAPRPVEQVSYHDIRENPANSAIDPNWPATNTVHADSFMGKLRAKTGLTGFDLPMESQWEFACRAGTATSLNSGKNLTGTDSCPTMSEVGRYWYTGGSDYTQHGDTSVGSAKAGCYLPNAWGLYDMHGNVSEWCLDWHDAYPGTVSDPPGAASGLFRADRGGTWRNNSGSCRSALRGFTDPSARYNFIGFRLAKTLP